MYGIVNKAIQELVTNNLGEDKWTLVLEKSEVDEEFFLSHDSFSYCRI